VAPLAKEEAARAPRRLAGGVALDDDMNETVEAALVQHVRRKFAREWKAVPVARTAMPAEKIEVRLESPGLGARGCWDTEGLLLALDFNIKVVLLLWL
jgi:hypothetical protein